MCLVGQCHWETRLCVLVNWQRKRGSGRERWERLSEYVRMHILVFYVEGTNYLVLPRAGMWTSTFRNSTPPL